MKTKTLIALGLAAFALASCVSSPSPSEGRAASAERPTEPVRKERIEEYQVPVVVKETRSFADGLVDRVTSYSYSADFASLLSATVARPTVATPIERVEYALDQAGRPARKTVFGSDGAVASGSAYEYDAAGLLVREVNRDAKNQVVSQSEWAYQNGVKAAWRVLDPSGVTLARTEYRYEGGLLVEARLHGAGGALSGSIRYEYADFGEAKGLLVAERYFNASGAQDGSVAYEHGPGGLPMKETRIRADGRRERIVDYEYGPRGELVKTIIRDGTGAARESVAYENAWRTMTRVVVYFE